MKKKVNSPTFNKIISDIKSIKIQGAENVCKAGIQAYLLQPSKSSAKQILSTRPTEPLLQNALIAIQKSKSPKRRESAPEKAAKPSEGKEEGKESKS